MIFLCVAAAIAMLSINNRRGLLWIAALTLVYFASGAYWRLGLPHPVLVAGLMDAALVLAVVIFGALLWEMWFGLIVLLCGLTNIAFLAASLAGAPWPHDTYGTTLELLNAAALILIGGVSAFMQKGSTDGLAFHPWVHIFGFARAARRAHR